MIIRLLVVLALLFGFAPVYAADSFEDFKKQSIDGFKNSKGEFKEYKSDIDEAFAKYKKILDSEFSAYKSSIAGKWDDVEVSTNTKWVEYLNDYRIRKVVDYDKQEIRIDVIGGSGADLKPVLKDLLTEDNADAFRRDPVAFNTEKQLKIFTNDVLSDKVDDEQVLAGIFSKDKLTDREADKLAGELLKGVKVNSNFSDKAGKPVASATIKLPKDTYISKAKKITPFVKSYSERFKLDPAVVMSVIYNESRFNPLAKSYVPAYGLMQIVPKSAGVDAIQFLEGKKKILAPSYLYNSENNVKIGTAYFHILYYRYFKSIKNPKSRLYCSIAAYNTGAGNVAYAFNKNNGGRYSVSKAAPVINSMSPQRVYEYLKNNLRYAEARRYIVKVTGKIKDY